MAIADLSVTANDTYVGGSFYMIWWLTGDALSKCGYTICDHATNDLEVIVCTVNTAPYGVTALQNDVDIDTLLADGVMAEFYSLHAGTVLRIPHEDDSGAGLKGNAYVTSIDGDAGTVQAGTTAGLVAGYGMKTYDAAQGIFVELIT